MSSTARPLQLAPGEEFEAEEAEETLETEARHSNLSLEKHSKVLFIQCIMMIMIYPYTSYVLLFFKLFIIIMMYVQLKIFIRCL